MISPIKKRPHQPNRYFGFTLLELIFVAAILIFIATLAIPQFRKSFNFLGQQSFVSDVVSFARYAHAKAIIDENTNRLVFDLENKYMRIESAPDDEQWQLEKSKPIPDFISIDFEDAEGIIKFYPDGTADEASFKISIPSGKTYPVSIHSATGYVKIEEPQ
ncbi:MAG: hypothetical protein AMJ78_08290 [Omnitrophica WOR_2 bacterium SM23_29]|nr:MAG: hypothetical protein AMJ78_08290 [Omnitrophica WOR_2 bacterium SM23_29]